MIKYFDMNYWKSVLFILGHYLAKTMAQHELSKNSFFVINLEQYVGTSHIFHDIPNEKLKTGENNSFWVLFHSTMNMILTGMKIQCIF